VLQVNDEYSDEDLIEDVFLKGYCKNVSNIETVGEDFSVGHFFNGDNIIGIDRGIILSSGDIRNASSPNTDTETTTKIGTTGDKDLSIIATAPVFDAAGISFDFVPLGNRVSFRYVFASEEYCEWVDTEFNDVFGFFVSGPGINGEYSNNAINVALIPGSDEFVSINTINHKSNSSLFIRNELEADATRCAIPFVPEYLDNIEYDGFTRPLIAEFDVRPCETYTIRLVVSDVNDERWDSAVFLEMNSFDIGGNIKVTASAESSMDTLVSEGCTDGVFTFERVNYNIDIAETFEIELNTNSTAELGKDIEDIPLTVSFLPGEISKQIPIKIIDDNLSEGQETLSLGVVGECECSSISSGTLLISDGDFFSVDFDDYEACENQPFDIEPIIYGGAPPYVYEWDDGSTEKINTTTINEIKSFDLLVKDQCSREASSSLTVGLKQAPTATLDGEYLVCNGLDQFVDVDLGGSPPWELSYQIDNDPAIEEIDIITQPFMIPAVGEGEVKLITFNDRTCQGLINGTAVIVREEIEIDIIKTLPTCQNTFDGEMILDIISDSPAASISWTPRLNDEYQPTELQGGIYNLMITDERGCVLEEEIKLNSDNKDADACKELNIYIPNIYSPNGDGSEDNFLIHLEHEPQIVSVRSFSIYDRWGNRIFEKNNFATSETDLGFDAVLKDKILLPSILGYVATLNMFDGKTRSISGTITVIR